MSDKELSKDVLKVSSSAEINAEPVEEKTAVSVVKICGMTEAQVRTGVSGMSFKDSVDHEFESEDCGEVHIRLTGPKKAVICREGDQGCIRHKCIHFTRREDSGGCGSRAPACKQAHGIHCGVPYGRTACGTHHKCPGGIRYI